MKGLTKNDLIRIYIIKPLLRLVYFVCSLSSLRERLVVFADDRTNEISANFKETKCALEEQGDFTFCYLVKDTRKFGFISKVVAMVRDTVVLARAKYIFVEDYYFPLYCFNKRRGQVACQLWHACGAFKKWGYSVLDSSAGNTPELAKKLPFHTNYDLATTSSESIIPNYADAYNMHHCVSNVRALGVPRTDVFFRDEYLKNCREKFRETVDNSGKKVLLYAPTYRGTPNSPDTTFLLPLEQLYTAFSKDYTLVIKLHPFMGDCVKVPQGLEDFCKVLPSSYDVNELLPVADLLITDYSSLIFEYSLFSKPMVFFAYDVEKYDDAKGFYYDYRSFVPGEIVTSASDVVGAIERAESADTAKLEDFRQKFMGACDGNSAVRIAKEVTSL